MVAVEKVSGKTGRRSITITDRVTDEGKGVMLSVSKIRSIRLHCINGDKKLPSPYMHRKFKEGYIVIGERNSKFSKIAAVVNSINSEGR